MHLVTDVGNTRMKWGWCGPGGIVQTAALAPDDPDAWRNQISHWHIEAPQSWTIAGSHPARRDQFADWLRQRGDTVQVLTRHTEIPLVVKVPRADRVGHDRLLNALAAKALVPAGVPAVIVSIGSAVTVDLLDDSGAFAGGAIYPGMRLMAQALHEHTAVLPLVAIPALAPPVPGTDTEAAMQAGIFWAVAGGIAALVKALCLVAPSADPMRVLVTGGDAPRLEFCDFLERSQYRVEFVPRLTLEGIRLAVPGRS